MLKVLLKRCLLINYFKNKLKKFLFELGFNFI